MAADELIFDPGVLLPLPLCEFQGYHAAARHGGLGILPWRTAWLEATAAGVDVRSEAPDPGEVRFSQALVHLQKSRAASWRDLLCAWELLEPGGRLLLCGGNDLGVTSAVKRLARELEQAPRILANRRHARIVAFERGHGPGPLSAESTRIALPLPDGTRPMLHAEPGVFSAKRLDVGTELLLETLAEQPSPRRVLDMGCGIGPLAFSALSRWPEATALLLDADARAVASASLNAAALGLETRCQIDWWDAEEPCPEADFDLALVNPPFHGGKEVDLRPAHSMFARLGESLALGGRALIVANRTLPYEDGLENLGTTEVLGGSRGYKIIGFTRRANRRSRVHAPRPRSSGSNRR
jgi:16S rRNA (guanine1207-N2)-methyltransferase